MQTELENSTTVSVANEVRACLVAHARGAISQDVLATALKGFALSSPDAVWEVLSLLDQYHRRNTLPDAAFHHLKEQLRPIAFKERSTTSSTTSSKSGRDIPLKLNTGINSSSEPTKLRNLPPHEPMESLEDTNELLFVIPETANEVANTLASGASRASHEPAAASRQSKLAASAAPRNELVSDQGFAPRTSKQAAQAHNIAPGKVLAGRFIIESALSFGRHTAVFRARDLSRAPIGNHFVALKMLLIATPESWLHFEHEQQIGQRLSHPRLVKSSEMRYDNKLPFFTMELVEGNTLGELLEAAQSRRAKTQKIIAGLVDALSYLHQQHYAHGDLHPDNVMVSATGEIKLIDYGTARYFGDEAGKLDEQVTATGDSSTAPTDNSIYASCQRLEGEAALPSDDIFSLSCIVYELLTGQHPFKRVIATQARALGQQPASVPALQVQQWQSLKKGLAWDREHRTADIAEWSAGFVNNEIVKPALPTPPLGNVPPASIAASPRIAPAAIDVPKPSPPPSAVRRTTHQPSRWPLLAIGVCSVVAMVVIVQFELGTPAFSPQGSSRSSSANSSLNSSIASPPTASRQLSSSPADVAAPVTATAAGVAAPATTSALHNANHQDQPMQDKHTAVDAALPTTLSTAAPTISSTLRPPAAPATLPTNAGARPAIPMSMHTEATPPLTVSHSSSATSITPSAPVKSVAKEAAVATAKTVDAKPSDKPIDKVSEAHGKVGFSQETYYISKRARYVPITINRTNGTSGKVTFVWWTENGTAEEGADYMAYGRKTEVLNSGKRRITVFVPLIADLGKGKGHVFFVNLGSASNGLTLGPLVRAKVVISD